MSWACMLRAHRARSLRAHWEYARSAHRVHAATRRALGLRRSTGCVSLPPAAAPTALRCADVWACRPRPRIAVEMRAPRAVARRPSHRPASALRAGRLPAGAVSPRRSLVLAVDRRASAPSVLLFPRPPLARSFTVYARVSFVIIAWGTADGRDRAVHARAHVAAAGSSLQVHAW